MTNGSPRSKWRMFSLLCLVAAVLMIAAAWHAMQRHAVTSEALVVAAPATDPEPTNAIVAPDLPVPAPVAQSPAPTAPVPEPQKRIFYRYTGLDQNYGRLAFQVGDNTERQFAGALSCDVAYIGGNRGICLMAKRGVITTYSGKLFNATTFEVLAEFPLGGVPSRSRVSLDGKLAAYTAFLTGHGYDALDFSTETLLLDVGTAKVRLNLETDFVVLREGSRIKEQDFNFWGVTFTADARQFYATLSTGGKHFLVRGDIAAKTMTVLHENVECPSLSPDGTRVAYKKRFLEGGRILWQLHVLNLADLAETAIAERRSIDDQLEWLDNRQVLYSVPQADTSSGGGTDVWVAPADGRGSPRQFLRQAYSPSVSR